MRVSSPAEAQQLGIATVFQDLALCDNLDVVANLYLGRELRKGSLQIGSQQCTELRGGPDNVRLHQDGGSELRHGL